VDWSWHEKVYRPKVLALSPDGKHLAVGGDDNRKINNPFAPGGFLIVLDVETGKTLVDFNERTGEDDQIAKDLISRGKVTILRPGGLPLQAPYPGDSGFIRCLSWSPDSLFLYAGYGTGIIKKWRLPVSDEDRHKAEEEAQLALAP
jgi:WD40 repeat protein